jgi:hypothetical protein
MSDFTPRLPDRPSLAQLRKRAKELLRLLRNGDPSATERLCKYKPNVSNPILADAQFVLAREHGFESWPRLVHHIQALHSASYFLSSKPPFYRINWTNNIIEPRQPMSTNDWENVCAVIKELGLTRVNSASFIGDDDLRIISQLDQITSLNLDGSKRLTDEGLRYLARMPQLRELTMGGQITDRGLEVLRELRELRVFKMFWQNNITDDGIANLRKCDHLEEVDLLGCNTGDSAIAALAEKPKLCRFKTGRNVSDEGLPLLHKFPAFKSGQVEEPGFGLMSFSAEPTNLLIDGPFTRSGLNHLRGLDGLVGLSFFWHTSRLRGDDLQCLDGLSNLLYLGCQGELCDDDAMRHIAALPKLRMLMGQGTVATDDGFRSLSQSQTIEYFWGRECPNLKAPGFVALSQMPALKGLAASCKSVDDAALASLPEFPALKELVPMGFSDDGFRHIGRSQQLETLILMYCRDTTDIATTHITEMSNLKKYHAGYTLVTDTSLELLSRIKSLEEISFEGCRSITNAGISFLTTLPRLREITIGGCPGVTRSGVTGFASGVRISYDPL